MINLIDSPKDFKIVNTPILIFLVTTSIFFVLYIGTQQIGYSQKVPNLSQANTTLKESSTKAKVLQQTAEHPSPYESGKVQVGSEYNLMAAK
ncbi:MAG TPA: hypothetical protein VE130_15640, partial [Nitrososphaeraceae archaeon]|nr:hypothetical protein [Nitrososphaeraceae archaeon]